MSTTARGFKLPDLGEGVKEGRVLRLLVGEGDDVAEDQLLMEVETDKAAVEIPSPFAGTIAQLHVSENEVVNVGDLMVTFGDGDGTNAAPAKSSAPAEKTRKPRQPETAAAPISAPPANGSPRRKPASPAVRKLARTLSVDLGQVTGSGPGGRVLRRDVEAFAKADGAGAASAAPAVSKSTPAAPPPALPLGAMPDGTDETDRWGPVRRAPMPAMRTAIAQVMTTSAQTIPHVTDSDDADVTALNQMRRDYNETVPQDDRVGMLAFVIRAVTRALAAFPLLNSSLDDGQQSILYRRYYHIAVGVQTERGLVAPVLRDADRLSIPQISQEIARLAERARTGTLSLDETTGATYTISNAGAMGGSRYSTPIITPPQVAVLALGRSRQQAWVVDGTVVPRLIMPLSHSMDHRLIDGAVEIAFMQHIIQDLEKPVRLML